MVGEKVGSQFEVYNLRALDVTWRMPGHRIQGTQENAAPMSQPVHRMRKVLPPREELRKAQGSGNIEGPSHLTQTSSPCTSP